MTEWMASSSHRRRNPLTGEWILVSPHRTDRPWNGMEEKPDTVQRPSYDPQCYLCPGNHRASSAKNPQYTDTYVFTNDFSALQPEVRSVLEKEDDLFIAEPESGICRVVCYSPRHDLTLARMETKHIERIVTTWQDEFLQLGSRNDIGYVQIFENKGRMMGCSSPHPHGQIWGTACLPQLPAIEDRRQYQYQQDQGVCLLCSYLRRETALDDRIIFANKSFAALVPFWAVWPFEAMILPKRHISSLTELTTEEISNLASIMRSLAICYDNLFSTSFPYTMGIHQQPTDQRDHGYWHLHFHYYPPLLRSRSVKKHMVGYEMLAMPQRDITPEAAAAILKELSQVHYLERE